MQQLPITVEALVTLDAIERRGSFAKAAEELNKATSALSYTVQKLEEQLGVTLFQRQGRRSVLTPPGRLLLDEGRKILGATHHLTQQVRELASGWEPKLRLGIESTCPCEPVFSAIAKLLEEQPRLEIDTQECVLSGAWEALELGRVDILVGAAPPVPQQKGFRTHPIATANMVLAVAPEHPLARIANEPELLDEQIPHYRRIVTHDTAQINVMRTEGLTSGEQVLYVQTTTQKVHAQLAGLGAGHLSRDMIEPYLESGELVELHPATPNTRNTERYIAWQIANKGKATRRLIELLLEHLPAAN